MDTKAQSIMQTLELREIREPRLSNGAKVIDVSDWANKKLLGYAYRFFGRKDTHNEPDLSHQWLSEIIVGPTAHDAESALAFAQIEKVNGSPIGQQLNLTSDYSCSAVGTNLRIVTKDIATSDPNEMWNYAIVDEASQGEKKPFLVSEIWVRKCADLGQCRIVATHLRGEKLFDAQEFIQWEAVKYRVDNKL